MIISLHTRPPSPHPLINSRHYQDPRGLLPCLYRRHPPRLRPPLPPPLLPGLNLLPCQLYHHIARWKRKPRRVCAQREQPICLPLHAYTQGRLLEPESIVRPPLRREQQGSPGEWLVSMAPGNRPLAFAANYAMKSSTDVVHQPFEWLMPSFSVPTVSLAAHLSPTNLFSLRTPIPSRKSRPNLTSPLLSQDLRYDHPPAHSPPAHPARGPQGRRLRGAASQSCAGLGGLQ